MTKERKKKPGDQIRSGIDQDTLALKTINFIRHQLPAWRDDPTRPAEQSENKLNLQLCKFLDSCARNNFPMVRFDHEEYQTGRSCVDLSASLAETTLIGARLYTIYGPILVIEGKRLPAPSKEREKEYITGGKERLTGGIQRFKLGLHGADLNITAMVGYVQDRSAHEWHLNINKWILELAKGKIADVCPWNENEILKPFDKFTSKGLAHNHSIHNRTGSNSAAQIAIHHLWIEMTKS